jgi:maltooligosyltrehalose trehalohydrolase
MGEEFAETSPFLYFTSHSDPGLSRLVSEGRWKEFEEFTVAGDFVDPQSPEAFQRSKITWSLLQEPRHRDILDLYCELSALRKRWPCLHNGRKDLTTVEFDDAARWLRMERADPSGSRAVLFCNFSDTDRTPKLGSEWTLALSTTPQAGGPCSASLYLAKP